MIRAEILTDMGQYDVKLTDAVDLRDGWYVVNKTLKADSPFEGDGELLHIGKDAQIKHVRVYDDQINPKVLVAPADPQPGQNSMPAQEIVNWYTDYLGQQVAFRILLVHDRRGKRTIALPSEINDRAPCQVLKAETQKGLLLTWSKEQGGTWYGLEIDVLVPEADMGANDLRDYALDYIEETKKRKVSGTGAKAWNGWGAADKP